MLLMILICLLVSIGSISHVTCDQTTIGNFISQQIDKINNEVTQTDIELVEPSISMKMWMPKIYPKSDIKKVKVIKNSENHIFLLSDHEIISLNVNSTNKKVDVQLIGEIIGVEKEIIEVKIEKWNEIFVIVVLTDETLHIFHTRKKIGEIETDDDVKLSGTQTIQLVNNFCKFDLIRNRPDELFMVTYQIRNETTNKLTFFRWETSFFAEGMNEIVDLPNNSDMFIFTEGNAKLIILESFEGKPRVVIFQVDTAKNSLVRLQKLFLKQNNVMQYVIDENLYLIACQTEAFCAVYKWMNSQFRRHRKLSSQVFDSVKEIGSRHGLVIVEDFSSNLSFYVREEDVVSSIPALTINKTIEEYAIFKSKIEGKLFFVGFDFQDDRLDVTFHEVRVSSNAAEPRSLKTENPVECVINLKTNMRHRFVNVEKSKLRAESLQHLQSEIDLTNKKSLETRTFNIKNSTIESVIMPIHVSSNLDEMSKLGKDNNLKIESAGQDLRMFKDSRNQQNLRAESEVKVLEDFSIVNLIFKGKNSPFLDLVKKSDMEIVLNDDLKLESLSAKKILIPSNKINNLNLDAISRMPENGKIVGIKKTANINTKNLRVKDTFNAIPVSTILNGSSSVPTSSLIMNGVINVTNLDVKTINGIDVNSFFNDVFINGEKTEIKGNLEFSRIVKIGELKANQIQSVQTENFMTTSTDQEILGDVFINKFYARSIEPENVNGDKLRENVALLGEPNSIKVPTEFVTINVLDNLQLEEENSAERDANTLANIKNHIIGTHTSDLSQIYNNPVVIQGSLRVNDLSMFHSNAKIFVNGVRIPQNITASYWTSKGHQMIEVENFSMESSNIKSSSIIASNLNSHPVANLILLEGKQPQGPVDLVFKNSVVEGHINGMNGNVPSLIFLINATAVPLRGPPTVIRSSVDFQDRVTFKNLGSGSVNEIPFEDFCHTKNQEFLLGSKTIENVEVSHVEASQNFIVENYNKISLKNLHEVGVRIDQPIELESLKLTSFSAENIRNNFFEEFKLDEFLSALGKEFSGRESSSSRKLKISGNCSFIENIFLTSLNGPTNNVNNFFNLLVQQNDPEVRIGGLKTFKDLTILQNLQVNSINDFSVRRLLEKSLSSERTQTFEGEIFVKNLNVNHLQARSVNKILFDKFVDKTNSELLLQTNLKVKKLKISSVIADSSTFDLGKIMELIAYPKRLKWPLITADNGIELPFGQRSFLDFLYLYAVLRDGPPQQVKGKVEVKENQIYVKSLIKNDFVVIANYPIDIQQVFVDSVKNESSTQTISGIKSFLGPVYFSNARIGPYGMIFAEKINEVNIKQLNSSIHRPGDVITSPKQFMNLHVGNVEIYGLLSGVEIKNYVAFYPNRPKYQIPRLSLDYLHVNDLNTKKFFNYYYLTFLRDRMMINSDRKQVVLGPIEFQSLNVINDTTVAFLNSVNINDLATANSDQQQVIHGRVIIEESLNILDNFEIGKLNENSFVELMDHSVGQYSSYRKDYLKSKSLNLTNGLIVRKSIGEHISLDTLNHHQTPKLHHLIGSMAHVQHLVSDLTSYSSARSSRRMYIDFDRDIQISQNLESSQKLENCENHQTIQPIKHNEILVRSKRGEVEMKVLLPSVKILLNSVSNCKNEFHTIEMRMIFNDDLQVFHNLSFENSVDDIKFTETKNGIILMVLTMLNKSTMESQIVVEKISRDDIAEVQRIEKLNSITKTTLVASEKDQFMVVSSFHDENSPHDEQFLKIFILCHNQTAFKETSQQMASEKYDIILSINVDHMTFLLLAKTKRKDLFIYRLHDDTNHFKIQHKISFDDGIKEIVVFYTPPDPPSFIVSISNGHFCNFEWRGIESWKSTQCGFFKRNSQIQPYQHLQRNHLYISNSDDDATALTLFRQGDQI